VVATEITVEAEAEDVDADPDRDCHLLPVHDRASMVALCGYDCTGRMVHSEETCVIEGHRRCWRCQSIRGGGLDRLLRDLLDDRPF
jgi:hypothetical protein